MLWWRRKCWPLRKKLILVEAHPLKRKNIAVLQMFSSVFHFLWNLLSTLFCHLFPFSYSLSLIAARNILSEQHSPSDDRWDLNDFFDNFQIKILYQPVLFTLHQDMSFMSKKSKCFFLPLNLWDHQVLLFSEILWCNIDSEKLRRVCMCVWNNIKQRYWIKPKW